MVNKAHKAPGVRIVVYTDGMSRPPKAGTIAVRADDELIAAIDEIARLMSTPWEEATRSEVVRSCILAGLPIVREHAQRVAAAGKPGKAKAKK